MTLRSRWAPLAVLGMLVATVAPSAALAQRCRVEEVDAQAVEVAVGARQPLIVFFRDAQGLPCQDEPTYTATSANPSIARIEGRSGAYTVVGVANGQTLINVRTGAARTLKTGAAPVAVQAPQVRVDTQSDRGVVLPPRRDSTPPPPGCNGPGCSTLIYQPAGSGAPVGIEVTPRELLMLPSEERALSYRTATSSGSNAERLPLQFQVTSNPRVVAVDTIGVVSARDTGTAAITVTAVGRSGIVPAGVRVIVRADSITFARAVLAVAPGAVDTVLLRVPAQNRNLEGRLFRFRSDDTSVVRVNLYDPYLTAVAAGAATITAEPVNPVLASIRLPVRVFQPAAAIQTSEQIVTLAIRQTRSLTMRPVTADSTFIPYAPRQVSGLDTSKVTAVYDTTTGIFTLTGIASGETSITMRVQNGRDSASAMSKRVRIRVVAGGLQLSTTRTGLGVGERVPLTFVLLDDARRPLDGITPDVRWTSSDSAVARFEGGAIVGRGVGFATVTGRTAWDSAATVEVFVSPDMMIVKQQAGVWNLFGRLTSGAWNRITNDSLIEGFPSWSPDLTRIVYALTPSGRTTADLYIANSDGTGARRLFGMDESSVRRPSFVRGTDQIVFELNNATTGGTQIWSVGVDGSSPRSLPIGTAGPFAGFPAVSPDGRRILYVSSRPPSRNYDVYLANIDGSNDSQRTTNVRLDDSPVWHPDGQSFFFVREEGDSRRPAKRVWRMDVRSDSAVAVSPVGMYVQAFSVSADGNTLALTELVQPANEPRLQLLNLTTGALTLIALEPGERVQPTPAAMRPLPAPAAASSGARP